MKMPRAIPARGVVFGLFLGVGLLSSGCGGKPETGTQESSPELKQTLDNSLDAAVQNSQENPQAQ